MFRKWTVAGGRGVRATAGPIDALGWFQWVSHDRGRGYGERWRLVGQGRQVGDDPTGGAVPVVRLRFVVGCVTILGWYLFLRGTTLVAVAALGLPGYI